MSYINDKIKETRDAKRDRAKKGWRKIIYQVILLAFLIILLAKTNGAKFDVFWNIFHSNGNSQVIDIDNSASK